VCILFIMAIYSENFFAGQCHASRQSAREILPIVFELARPGSVIDVGCGVGPWLAAARELGARELLGVDGSWVQPSALMIPRECFLAVDLTKPLQVGRTFDLAMCMEVAEHLPESSAQVLIDSLVSLAPLVLFSAAVPAQGGLHHINEQWPQYWENLFRSRGYVLIDCIRTQVWNNPRVEPWYAQNCFLFARGSYLLESPKLAAAQNSKAEFPLAVVHPTLFFAAATLANVSMGQLIRAFPGVLSKTTANRTRRLFSVLRGLTRGKDADTRQERDAA